MSGKLPAQIVKRQQWAPGLFTLQLDCSRDFSCGQFFNLGIEREGKELRRSYSAASAPGVPLEFFISEVPEGELTPSLSKLAIGDTLLLDETPLGFFTLKEVPDCEDLWLVATGTGIGPYISMLRDGGVLERFKNVFLVHGVRHREQLAYFEELKTRARQSSGFHYLPTLSGDPADEDQGILAGRITGAWDNGALEGSGASFGAKSHMLLCGNPQMIDDMVGRLKERGFEKHRRRKPGHFNFERYW